MKKLNVKTIVIGVVLLAVMVLLVIGVTQIRTLMSGAAGGVEPNGVTAVPGSDGKTAVITWTSDKESIGKVEYGATAASLVLMAAETTETANHSVSLSSLRSDTTYYYRIRVGEEVFDNGGVPYSFKTKADATVVVSPTAIPTVALVSDTDTTSTTSGTVCDSKTDYNKDGNVNSLDLTTCKKNGGKVSATATETVVTPKPTTSKTTTTPAVDCNGTIADYNSDGLVNSLDRINCLKSQQ